MANLRRIFAVAAAFSMLACASAPDPSAIETGPPLEETTSSPTTTATRPAPESTTSAEPDPQPTTQEGVDPPRGFPLWGQVSGPDGEGIAGICIDIWRNGDTTLEALVDATRTTEAGYYKFSEEDLRDNVGRSSEITLRFRDCRPYPRLAFEWYGDAPDQTGARWFTIAARSRADADLGPGGSITGRITGPDGEPTHDLKIEVWDGTFVDNDESGDEYKPYGTVTTDENGRYRAGGLAAKTYRLFFRAWPQEHSPYVSEWYDDHIDLARCCGIHRDQWPPSMPVALASNEDRAGINARLQRPGYISGTIDGTECSNDAVVILPETEENNIMDDRPQPEADGTWSRKIRPGSYKVQFSWCGEFGYSEWWENAPTRDAADIITVGSGETVSGIDAQRGIP